MKTSRQIILDRLRREAPALRDQFGVKDLAVFGSTARDEIHASSDLDLLVTFSGRPDFDRYMGLKFHLEDMFGRTVDLVTSASLRSELRSRIEREAIHVS